MKDVKEAIALEVLANMFNKASGIINLTRRTTRPKCKTCSGPKCVHINIYMGGSKKGDETENMKEIMKKKNMTKNKENTEIINSAKLPRQKRLKKINLTPLPSRENKSMFLVSLLFTPLSFCEEKEEIKNINTEDIFPKNMIVSNLNNKNNVSMEMIFLEIKLQEHRE